MQCYLSTVSQWERKRKKMQYIEHDKGIERLFSVEIRRVYFPCFWAGTWWGHDFWANFWKRKNWSMRGDGAYGRVSASLAWISSHGV